MADIGTLLKMIEGQNPPAGMLDDLQKQQAAMNQLINIIGLKKKGFDGQGVDTGPIAQFYPNVISSFIAQMQGMDPQQASSRAQLNSGVKDFFNAYKLATSGTAVSNQERGQDIEPVTPNMGDDEANFYGKSLQNARNLSNKRMGTINTLQGTGYKTPQFNEEEFVNQIKQMLYGK
jgi:hypothetical protein